MAHPVERELLKVTAYKSRTKFSDRQDYLSSILNAVMKLTDEDFDNLSDEAAAWANAAVEAKNSKKDDLPDFDEVAEADEEDADDSADEADDEDGDDGEGDSGDDSDPDDDDSDPDSPDADADDGDSDDPEEEEAPDEADDPEDEDAAEDEPPAKPAKKAATKPVKKAAKTPAPKPAKPKLHNRNPRAHEDEDVVLDKWGCMDGSKNSRALAMFEKGATTKEVKESIGGTYYNVLKKMQQDGHTIEKEGAVIKLIHKAEKATKPVAKAKPATKKKK